MRQGDDRFKGSGNHLVFVPQTRYSNSLEILPQMFANTSDKATTPNTFLVRNVVFGCFVGKTKRFRHVLHDKPFVTFPKHFWGSFEHFEEILSFVKCWVHDLTVQAWSVKLWGVKFDTTRNTPKCSTEKKMCLVDS